MMAGYAALIILLIFTLAPTAIGQNLAEVHKAYNIEMEKGD